MLVLKIIGKTTRFCSPTKAPKEHLSTPSVDEVGIFEGKLAYFRTDRLWPSLAKILLAFA